MPIVIAANPLHSVAIGSGQSLEEFDALQGVLFRGQELLRSAHSEVTWPMFLVGRRRLLILLVITALVLLTFDQRGNRVIDGAAHRVHRCHLAAAQPGPRSWPARPATRGTA